MCNSTRGSSFFLRFLQLWNTSPHHGICMEQLIVSMVVKTSLMLMDFTCLCPQCASMSVRKRGEKLERENGKCCEQIGERGKDGISDRRMERSRREDATFSFPAQVICDIYGIVMLRMEIWNQSRC